MRYSDSRRNQASWQNDLSVADNQLLSSGVDYQQEHLDSDTGYLASTRSDTGTFAQYQGTFGRHEVQLSARHDHNQQFGNHDTGAAAWGYHLDHGLRVSASYGSAFHAPTFNDLYYPYGSGNPDLRPEKSRSAELGVAQQGDGWNWALNAYQTRIDQLITLDSNYFPLNISQARIRGLEGQLGLHPGRMALAGLSDAAAAAQRRWRRQRRALAAASPGAHGRIDMDRDFGGFAVGADLERAPASAMTMLANSRAAGRLRHHRPACELWRSHRAGSCRRRLANAFDRHYETVYYFNQPGRSWYLTLRYSPRS